MADPERVHAEAAWTFEETALYLVSATSSPQAVSALAKGGAAPLIGLLLDRVATDADDAALARACPSGRCHVALDLLRALWCVLRVSKVSADDVVVLRSTLGAAAALPEAAVARVEMLRRERENRRRKAEEAAGGPVRSLSALSRLCSERIASSLSLP